MNEKVKHTPGKWRVAGVSLWDVRAGSRFICHVGPLSPGGYPEPYAKEDRANASRIVACVNGCEGIADPSAVRELLEALEELFDGYVVAMHGARTCDCDESVGHVLCSPCKARAAIAKARGEKGGAL